MINSIPNVPNKQDAAYFIGNRMTDSEYVRLISGFVRGVLKDRLFPEDLLQCICRYGNKQSTYFVTYSEDTFRIDRVQ